jgi:hypothetical protein
MAGVSAGLSISSYQNYKRIERDAQIFFEKDGQFSDYYEAKINDYQQNKKY